MSSVSQYHNLLPEPIKSETGRKNNFATAVRNVLFLTRTLPGHANITYRKFVEDFPKFVKLTEFEDNPYLYYTQGKKKGQLKEVNLSTLQDTWVHRYNFNEDFKKFKAKVAYEIATQVQQDTIISIPGENKLDDEIFEDTTNLQKDVLHNPTLSQKDKAYINRACQQAKDGLVIAKNIRQEQARQYQNTIDEYNNIVEEETPNVIPTFDNPPWDNPDMAFERDRELREALFRKRGDTHK